MSETELQARDGLDWDDSGFEVVPRWTRLPELDAISTVCNSTLTLDNEKCKISFYDAGAFNRLYLVTSKHSDAILRVSLPVDPHHKTAGEVATLRWVRAATNVPAPRVFAYNDAQQKDNAVGFEWIMMERMQGVPAYKRWRSMSMKAKTAFVEQLAHYQSQLFRASFEEAQFRGIGTLEEANNTNLTSAPTQITRPGRIVSREFFWNMRQGYEDIARGPFASSHDWLQAKLAIIRREQSDVLSALNRKRKKGAADETNDDEVDKDDDDDDDRKDAEARISLVNRLEKLLPKIFPVVQTPPERTVLWHCDLSLHNILIHDSNAGCDNNEFPITAIVDWESVSTQPLWVAAGVPYFMVGLDRENKPNRDMYADASETGNSPGDNDNDSFYNEGKTELYWDHVEEYELTQLRHVYSAKMTELWSRWAVEAADAHLRADFGEAVDRCSDLFGVSRIVKWVELVESGQFLRLHDIMFRWFYTRDGLIPP